jgi:hypothetical protein
MDPLTVVTSWQFVLFGLAIASVMYVLRIVVEYFMELGHIDPDKNKLWNKVMLPILPVIIGAIWATHLRAFPYPDNMVSRPDRLIFGLVAGLLSGLIYRVVKAVLYQKVIDVVQHINKPPINVATNNVAPSVPPSNLPPRGQL